ncbi:glycine/betaine ABC transporter permease, partial [Cobetia marina]
MSEWTILDPFQVLHIPLGEWVEDCLNYLVSNFRGVFRAVRWPIDQVLNGIEGLLQAVPPTIGILLGALLGWQVAGRRMGLFCAFTLILLGLIGVWSESMTTLSLVLTAVFFCAVFGLPLGILC